jgi:hypothetical protein
VICSCPSCVPYDDAPQRWLITRTHCMNACSFKHTMTTQLNMQSVKPLPVNECKVTLLKISGQLNSSATTPDSEDLGFEYRQDNQLYLPSWVSYQDLSFHISNFNIFFIKIHSSPRQYSTLHATQAGITQSV